MENCCGNQEKRREEKNMLMFHIEYAFVAFNLIELVLNIFRTVSFRFRICPPFVMHISCLCLFLRLAFIYFYSS